MINQPQLDQKNYANYIGIYTDDCVKDNRRGVFVTGYRKYSTHARNEIEIGDQIISFNSEKINSSVALSLKISNLPVGFYPSMKVIRNGILLGISVTTTPVARHLINNTNSPSCREIGLKAF